MKTELAKDIHWVGCVDWPMRDFHSFATEHGVTYNSYLVVDQKTALIDTVKAPFARKLLANISTHTSPYKIDYIVVNHAEPDHAGALKTIINACTNATIVCNEKCRQVLTAYNDTSGWHFQIVKDGDTLTLGERSLRFIDTPMVHWPESMFTYVPEENILFSMDAFGQHYCSSSRFDRGSDMSLVMLEAKKYYANIVMPYRQQVAKALQAAEKLVIDMIAPAHGVIWHKHVREIVDMYKSWSDGTVKPKVLVIYDSMWDSTKQMAQAIFEGANEHDDVDARLIYARSSNLTEIATEALDAAAIAIGSPTLNMGMMPSISALLTYLKGLRPPAKQGLAFGSYGWGKGGPENIEEQLEGMGVQLSRETLRSQWRPSEERIKECRSAGRLLVQKILEA